MAILVHEQHATITTAAGAASANIKTKNNICGQILIIPTTATTTYDFTLTDIYSTVVLREEDIQGEYSRFFGEGLLTYGNWTFDITGATADEDFQYLFTFREQ